MVLPEVLRTGLGEVLEYEFRLGPVPEYAFEWPKCPNLGREITNMNIHTRNYEMEFLKTVLMFIISYLLH